LPRRPETGLSLDAVREGGKPALAWALAEIEAESETPGTLAFLDAAYAAARASTIGLTGPPGVGKSTLTGKLIEAWRQSGRTVGVIAVDPSSPISGGALLGDRTRLRTDPSDQGVFVRSMAARDRLGGIADLTLAAMVLMRALFDLVLIETVGVGQSETDVASIVDTVVLCVQPGSGDTLQFMKAGLFELPHIVVVTKTDMGESAARAQAELAASLRLSATEAPALLGVSARTGEGVGELVAAIDRHRAVISEDLSALRHKQARAWVVGAIKARWGSTGLARAGSLEFYPPMTPFSKIASLQRHLSS